jgi:hypothetical protein
MASQIETEMPLPHTAPCSFVTENKIDPALTKNQAGFLFSVNKKQ